MLTQWLKAAKSRNYFVCYSCALIQRPFLSFSFFFWCKRTSQVFTCSSCATFFNDSRPFTESARSCPFTARCMPRPGKPNVSQCLQAADSEAFPLPRLTLCVHDLQQHKLPMLVRIPLPMLWPRTEYLYSRDWSEGGECVSNYEVDSM